MFDNTKLTAPSFGRAYKRLGKIAIYPFLVLRYLSSKITQEPHSNYAGAFLAGLPALAKKAALWFFGGLFALALTAAITIPIAIAGAALTTLAAILVLGITAFMDVIRDCKRSPYPEVPPVDYDSDDEYQGPGRIYSQTDPNVTRASQPDVYPNFNQRGPVTVTVYGQTYTKNAEYTPPYIAPQSPETNTSYKKR